MKDETTDDPAGRHISHCSTCGCEMDISAMEPYTKVVCPGCGHQERVKCELGNYILIGRHAVGGMSNVFKARDTTLDREVAIKILNEDYSRDEVRMKQFEHEALITAAISHPNVVKVYTVGKEFDHFYIAMEMVSGENLEQKISREGAIREDELLPMVAEIISGLEAAREAGLIHRDMKPGNILFDANGHVKIVDFGLALVTQGGLAKADEIWATPYYVPPEALDGEDEDFRSDVYSLGATLYHALSGKPSIPVETKSSRAVLKAKEKIAPLEKVAPWLKPETCHLVDKAMAFKREDRFESYAGMEESRALANQVVEQYGAAEPVRSHERTGRRAKEKIVVGSLLALGLIILLVFFTLLILKKVRDTGEGTAEFDYAAEAGLIIEDTSGYSPEVAARIGKRFHISHQKLQKAKYAEARKGFTKLMNDAQVSEPTASWAGVEAVIACLLDGDTSASMASVGQLRKHMSERGVAQDSRLGMLGAQLASPGTISKPDIAPSAMRVVHMMAVALKNWQAGAFDAAVPWFEKVSKQSLPEGSPLVVFRDIGARYLADYRELKPLAAMPPAKDIKQAQERLAAMQISLKKLQTKGRAPSHLGALQAMLEKQIEEFRKIEQEALKARQKKLEVPAYDELLPQFHQLVASSKFNEAAELLRKAKPAKGQQEQRDAWIYLTESAGAAIRKLEQRMANEGMVIDMESVDQTTYQEILAAKRGGLLLELDEGEVFLPWAKLKPESVLNLYREVFDLTVDTLEGQRLTQHAVCYAWLTGIQDKAKLAAEKLSLVNGNFKKRWAKAMEALEPKP